MRNIKTLLIASFSFLIVLGTYKTFAETSRSKEIKIRGTISTSKLQPRDFSKMSKISLEEAISIAKTDSKNNILSVSLETEDNYLVYAINTVDSKNALHEIVLDAANGKVLSSQTVSRHETSKNDDDEDED